MPVFEYKCSDCNEKFEVLHKSTLEQTNVSCPNCNSSNHKKLFSAFSASVSGNAPSGTDTCSTGSCGIPSSYNGCASGMCGLN
jgi:putative FmdB family regulatory protein